MSESITIELATSLYADHDDCLTAAAEDYAASHDLAGWDLSPRWADDQRDVILLDVPPQAWSVMDYADATQFEGRPSADLVRRSLDAGDTGAVRAYPDSNGVWQYVRDDDSDRHTRIGHDVHVIYVED